MIKRIHIPEANRLFTVAQSREADRLTVEDFGIDGFTLMEIAASGAADIIRKETASNKSGLFICGKGNNGGDALAAARYLIQRGCHRATIYFAMGSDELSPDAKKNYLLLNKLKQHGSDIHFSDSNPLNTDSDPEFDYIVDGIFGTGLSNDVRDPVKSLIDQINATGIPVYSMDVPSGLNADTGLIEGISVKATATITFGTNKTGFYFNNASIYTGTIHLVQLPFPDYSLTFNSAIINHKLDDQIPEIERKADHKYDAGVVHIIAGSHGLTGAAIMAAKSAWKSGAGAVILYTPENLLSVYEKNLPQIIKKVVGNSGDDGFKLEHSAEILDSLNQKPGVLLAGPGMGTSESSQKMLYHILSEWEGSVVLDADGLAAFKSLSTIPAEHRRHWLLTPHPGEADKYLNMMTSGFNDYEKYHSAVDFVSKFECSIVLKGNPTFLIPFDGINYVTGYDTTPFTRAGFGDVLSGTIAANLGITDNLSLSVIRALLSGHNKYNQIAEDEIFGPEHLI